MIDYLQDLIGNAPQGLEFLEYIFGGILVLFGIYVVYKILYIFLGKIF